ncbi:MULTISPECIES: tRNA (guanosine(46)-N7)-methyltransferase TrmB [unclassified Acinetobacter]|uniref:tRNA (guanosine(46)-N7)-methyltransferase TrmB n=1 Tax=unclassified Acinetobacter TaxID=196816 RepID=UPI0035BA11D1
MSENIQNVSHQREIVTFMRRSAPLNTSQRLAIEQHADMIVDTQLQFADVRQYFSNPEQPLTIEIGFGMGSSLVKMAQANPDRNFFGIEVHIPGIAQCVHEAGELGLTNLRVVDADAIQLLKNMPDNSIDTLQLYFPDPWQKKRHFKRRFVVPERMALVEDKLKVGGRFHAATDWQPYADWMLDVLEQRPRLNNLAGKGNTYPRPEWRPLTKFEQRGLDAGHNISDFIFEKIS